MAINFNHTIVWARDNEASARFLAQILGLPAPKRWGPFMVVMTDNGANIDFMKRRRDCATTLCFPRQRIRVRRNLWSGSRTVASLLGRSRADGRGRDESS